MYFIDILVDFDISKLACGKDADLNVMTQKTADIDKHSSIDS